MGAYSSIRAASGMQVKATCPNYPPITITAPSFSLYWPHLLYFSHGIGFYEIVVFNDSFLLRLKVLYDI